MPQTRLYYARGRPGFLGWFGILAALAVAVSVAVAVTIVAVGVFLFVLPIIVILAIVYAFIWRARFRRAMRAAPRQPMVIEGEFRAVDPSSSEPSRRQNG